MNHKLSEMHDCQVMDTIAPLDLFAKNGFYRVGTKIFNHKIHALQAASQSHQDVDWIFNDAVFCQINWSKRLNLSLLEIYRLRAQQLRQKYQYLIVCWSGGGDSTTMLESFLHNNIYLDEVLILWPTSLSPGKYVPSFDTSPENFMSEWDLNIKPRLNKLRAQYPKLKITIMDTFESPPKDEHHDDTVLIVEKHSYGTIQKWRALDTVLQARQQKYGSVAALLGVSPVDLSLIDDYACVAFDDINAYPGSKSDFMLDGTPRNIEFFYWSPNFPELVREQAHAIIDHLDLNPQSRKMVPWLSMGTDRRLIVKNTPDGEISRQFRKSILYPNYPLDTFQIRKQDDTHYRGSWETWFHSRPHAEEYLIAWDSAIRSHQALIDEKFLVRNNQNKIVRYKRFQTRWYPVAKLKPIL